MYKVEAHFSKVVGRRFAETAETPIKGENAEACSRPHGNNAGYAVNNSITVIT